MTDKPVVTEKSIEAVLTGLLESLGQSQSDLLDKCLDSEAVQSAIEALNNCSPEDYYFAMSYPLKTMQEGLFKQVFASLPSAQRSKLLFLFTQKNYVENQFRRLIEKYEGTECCADKSRFLLRALARHLVGGQVIELDWSQKYTFHYPERTFTNHLEIWSFFVAVYRLYYGHPDEYLAELHFIEYRCGQRESSPKG